MRSVYLDHASTTPLLPEAFEAMRPFLIENFAAASSLHQGGLRARDAIANARAQIATLINADSPEEIIFTSCGTESANLAIKGAVEATRRRGNHIVCSAIEHPAVLKSIEFLTSHGYTCTRVAVDSCGRLDPAGIGVAITDQTVLICVHHSNYDIGVIQPISEIARIASEKEIPLFVDASFSGGWVPVDVQSMGFSVLSLAPHRFYGPKGVGVLYRNRRVPLAPMIHGGVQEDGRRAGTENVAAIIGSGVAAEKANLEMNSRVAQTFELQKALCEGLQQKIPFVRLNGPPPGPQRICNQLNVSIEFVEGEGVLLMLDTRGIAIASGTACVAKSLKPSPVLSAIGLDDSLAQGAVILSPGVPTTIDDISYALETIASVVARLRGMSASWDEFQRGAIDSLILPGTQRAGVV
jgi:cysteine desulfurase